jgi:hypothetical protein
MSRVPLALLIAGAGCAPSVTELVMERGPETTTLHELWTRSRATPRQAPVNWSDAQVESARTLFFVLADAARQDDLAAAARLGPSARSLGYDLFTAPLQDGRAVAALDLSGPAGGCFFRLGTVSAEVLLQAPHSFFDRYTGVIGLEVFHAASLRGFCFNTSHRFGSGTSATDAEPGADAAHDPRSPLSAQTAAVLQAIPYTVVIQLHGFDEDSVAEGVDAIVSAGASAEKSARDLTHAALSTLGLRLRRYPEEIDVLGGTGNAQGKLVAASTGQFVHLELSSSARHKLKKPDAAAALAAALTRALAGGSI